MKKETYIFWVILIAIALVVGWYFFIYQETPITPSETKIISYTEDDGLGDSFRGLRWRAQVFTTPYSFEITKVDLWLVKLTGTLPGTITLSIVETGENGGPTNNIIDTTTVNGNNIFEMPSGTSPTVYEKYSFNFSSPKLLSGGTKYAFVISVGDIAGVYMAKAGENGIIATYEGGSRWWTNDGGSTWTETDYWDLNFEIYGIEQ